MKKSRASNIEILRIIAILLIISFHCVYKCNFVFDNFNLNAFIVKVFYMFGELGVNLFVLITGYFMCKKNFSFKKLLLLILEVNFYFLGTVLIAHKIGIYDISSTKDFFLLFFPTIIIRYWFVSAYIIIYILSPYFNILIQNMKKELFKKFLIILLVIWSVIPTIFGIFYNTTESMLYYSRFIWLIIIYFVGSYLRIYPPQILEKKKNNLLISSVTFTLMVLSIIFIQKNLPFFSKLGLTEPAYFWTPNSIPMFFLSISIFSIFLNLKIKNNNFINKIASTTLGIYMLHDGILSPYIWNVIFKTQNFMNSQYLIFHILLVTGIIFITGCVIDLIRQFFEKHIVIKILDFFEKKLKNNRILNKLNILLFH